MLISALSDPKCISVFQSKGKVVRCVIMRAIDCNGDRKVLSSVRYPGVVLILSDLERHV